MLYQLNDLRTAFMAPTHFMAEVGKLVASNPFLPTSYLPSSRPLSAGLEVVERFTRRFQRPSFGIYEVTTPQGPAKVRKHRVVVKTFCNLLHFQKSWESGKSPKQPKVLVVAPLSGHYATLLRDTVNGLLQEHDVYITDWKNSRDIPVGKGLFTLDDYIDYLLAFIRHLGHDLHILAVCQPAVPVMIANAILAQDNDPVQPRSMILMGGPIDTRINPTSFNIIAREKPLSWFERKVISNVPSYYKGAWRRVCPGFILLSGFMSMHLDRHLEAQAEHFQHLMGKDEGSLEGHRKFYDEYLAVMDLPADYYLDSIRVAFQEHLVPRNMYKWRDQPIDIKAISKTALMTVEGEKDDISCPGQTKAAQTLCTNIPGDMRCHYLQLGAGHYGIFNGSRWRGQILPKVTEFIAAQSARTAR